MNEERKLNLGSVSISFATIDCPECKKKGCGFCNDTGVIHFYPSPNAYDYIKIARAKYRISKRN